MEVNKKCIACDVERKVDEELGHWICPECGYWNEINSKRLKRAKESEESAGKNLNA